MECKSCKHWQRKKHYGNTISKWGICPHLASGAADIEFYANDREGELVDTTVETLPDWYCKEWEKKEGEKDAIQEG